MRQHSYWNNMTSEERSAEISRRRAKVKRPAGGFSYVSKERIKEISKLGVEARQKKNENLSQDTRSQG